VARPTFIADEPPAEGSEEARRLQEAAAEVEQLADGLLDRLRSLSQVRGVGLLFRWLALFTIGCRRDACSLGEQPLLNGPRQLTPLRSAMPRSCCAVSARHWRAAGAPGH